MASHDPTDASNNRIPIVETDPKQLTDDWTTTQSHKPGFHPGGMDNNNQSIFYPILAYDTDNEALETLRGDVGGMGMMPDDENAEMPTTLNTGPKIPNGNPKMPRPGSRLIDQSTNRNLGNF